MKEEAPFLVIDPNVCLELKQIAEEKGLDWREMTYDAIVKFCKKCSQEKEAKTETEKAEEVKEASTEEKKPKKTSIVSILKGEGEEEAKKEGSIEEKLKTFKIVRE